LARVGAHQPPENATGQKFFFHKKQSRRVVTTIVCVYVQDHLSFFASSIRWNLMPVVNKDLRRERDRIACKSGHFDRIFHNAQ